MRFNRRRFVQGLVSAGALAAFNCEPPSASAETSMTSVLTGKEFAGKYGGSADYTRAAGGRTATPSFVFRVRICR